MQEAIWEPARGPLLRSLAVRAVYAIPHPLYPARGHSTLACRLELRFRNSSRSSVARRISPSPKVAGQLYAAATLCPQATQSPSASQAALHQRMAAPATI